MTPQTTSTGPRHGAGTSHDMVEETDGQADAESLAATAQTWPEPPNEAAYHGPVGRIVRAIEPGTEADPFGVLVQLLIMFGSLVGRRPHLRVESTEHHVNEFAVLVGESATGRKGTSSDRAADLLRSVDPKWMNTRILSGLSSGEGVIAAVRDPVYRKVPIKVQGRIEEYQDELVDEGVADKRLLVLETEFGRALSVQGREGNTLSAVLRQSWDGKDLAVMTKNAYRATQPHVSIIGHITADELMALLGRVDAVNGYANRFLWIAVRRSKSLPFGGKFVDLSSLEAELAASAEFARDAGLIELAPPARAVWESHYERLTNPPPGPLGKVTSRAAPHVLRLAAMYALLDRSIDIADDHLRAALAVWDASARCAAYIFGASIGDPDAERILAALRAAGPAGMTRSEISSGVFKRNVQADRITQALALLLRHGLAREAAATGTGRRAAFRYYANERDEKHERSSVPTGRGRSADPPDFVPFVNFVPPTEEEVADPMPRPGRRSVRI